MNSNTVSMEKVLLSWWTNLASFPIDNDAYDIFSKSAKENPDAVFELIYTIYVANHSYQMIYDLIITGEFEITLNNLPELREKLAIKDINRLKNLRICFLDMLIRNYKYKNQTPVDGENFGGRR